MSHLVAWKDILERLPDEMRRSAASLPAPLVPIAGIALDSRQVSPGSAFVALTGGNTDGHRFIADAIQRGAVLVVGEKQLSGVAVPYLRVDDSREALAYLSAAYYGLPARSMTVIGVTGTDGKTTTCSLIHQILLAAGIQAGLISTVSAVIGERSLDTGFHVTTPEAPQVQSFLADMQAAGMTHVVLESTSHGLAQHRVTACDFDIGVVTNITHEHLDYHGSYDAYRSAKARLFTSLALTPEKPCGNFRIAILNRDDSSYDYLVPQVSRQISYGVNQPAGLVAQDIESSRDGIRFLAVGEGFQFEIASPLAGDYNVSNCLAAIAVTRIVLGIEDHAIQEGISRLAGIPGRMERIDLGQDFAAIVDFAHTPYALRAVLAAARSLAGKQGKVIAVFGSAGLRDRQKRRWMAEAAAELADYSVLTAEDPRVESLVGILAEMASGAVSRGGVEGQTFWRIPNRAEAIRYGVHLAQPGDVLLALGKGHEQSMCFGEIEYPWDDRVAMRAAIAELLNVPGPKMPYLPEPVE